MRYSPGTAPEQMLRGAPGNIVHRCRSCSMQGDSGTYFINIIFWTWLNFSLVIRTK